MRKKGGHTHAHRGKKVILFFHDGTKLVTRYQSHKSGVIFTDAGKFTTRECYKLSIYKEKPYGK